MTEPLSAPEWELLSKSAQKTVLHIARLLLLDISGQIIIECHDGGVRSLTVSRRYSGRDYDARLDSDGGLE